MQVNKVSTILIIILISSLLMSPVLLAKDSKRNYNDPLVRIKDITDIKGVRDNQLIGYGLVVGLNGSGDSSSSLTSRTEANMLKKFGINVNPGQLEAGNVAAVMVTAELPPFARPGQRIDLNVSSIGDAESLQGGTLLLTNLMGPNQQEVYVRGQGSVTIGGFNASQGGNSVRQNHTTVGVVPEGGIVEKEVKTEFVNQQSATLLLNNPNFETAQRIAETINQQYGYSSDGSSVAQALDPGRVKVSVPTYFKNKEVSFIAKVNKLSVRPDTPAKIVVNERTGTIVMGHNVRVSKVSVAHGNLTITISSQENVSQPPSLSEGETKKTEDTDIKTSEEENRLMVIPKGSSISDVVKALNGVGATPRDVIAILQAIKEAGALHAELEIM